MSVRRPTNSNICDVFKIIISSFGFLCCMKWMHCGWYAIYNFSSIYRLILSCFSMFLLNWHSKLRCFRPVSRTEAEVLLERHPDCGNMLLRPGRDGSSLAVTTRQDLNGSVFRHYRVTQKQQGGYIIDVESPIPCPTLHDVINALMEKTAGTLQPFILEEPYEENITFVSSNDENGERTLHSALSGPLSRTPSLPPKQVGADRWSLRSQTRSPSSSPRSFSPPGSPSNSMRRLVLSPSPLSQSLTDELKQKLEKRRASQQWFPPFVVSFFQCLPVKTDVLLNRRGLPVIDTLPSVWLKQCHFIWHNQ